MKKESIPSRIIPSGWSQRITTAHDNEADRVIATLGYKGDGAAFGSVSHTLGTPLPVLPLTHGQDRTGAPRLFEPLGGTVSHTVASGKRMAAVYPDDIQPGDGVNTPWSAALLEAALVSGSLSAPGEVKKCENGKWHKDMLLKLRFDRPLETWVIQEIKNLSGSMQPMVVLSGGGDDHSLFLGIHRMLHSHCDASSTTALCYVPKYEGEFKPAQFDVDTPPLPGSKNLAIRPRGSKSGATANAIVTIAPPLVFHTRMSMFHLDEINTVAQSFRADVYIEYRLRGITSDPDEGLVKALFDAYGFREDMLELFMAIDVISMERWTSISPSSTVPNTYDYALRLRARAIFAEQYELAEFPFDVQDMHITTTLNIPKIRATLIENLEFPSIMMHRTFQHKSVFDIVYGEVLSVEMTTSDPSESGAGYIYPRCTFITTLSRHHGYYITNVLSPMMVLTYLAAVSAGAVDSDGARMSTADRLSVTLTLMLTAVAYKFIVASALPQVSYLTSLDTYVLVCFLFLFLISVENVAWPAITASFAGEEPFDEVYIMVFYLGSFTLYNLAYMVRAWVKVAARGRRQRLRLAEFAERGAAKEDKRREREVAAVAGATHGVLRGRTASMLM